MVTQTLLKHHLLAIANSQRVHPILRRTQAQNQSFIYSQTRAYQHGQHYTLCYLTVFFLVLEGVFYFQLLVFLFLFFKTRAVAATLIF